MPINDKLQGNYWVDVTEHPMCLILWISIAPEWNVIWLVASSSWIAKVLLKVSGPCAHVPPAPPVRMREDFSTFLKKNFFATLPSSAVRALRACTPGAASAHARGFFDISGIFFFATFPSSALHTLSADNETVFFNPFLLSFYYRIDIPYWVLNFSFKCDISIFGQ